jgi:hypothetical protein
MSATPSGWAAGLLLVISGIWLLLQTLIGKLPERITGAAKSSGPNPSGTNPPGPAPNYNANGTPTQKSTNGTITSTLNPNPPPQTVPFLGGIPGTSSFNSKPPSS